MKFRLKKNGAHLAGGAALFCLTALALLPLGRMWVRMLGALAAAAAIWGYFLLFTAYARWGVQGDVFYSHCGLLFTNERHIPLRDVTAIRCLQSPLGRPLGLCYLTVFAAGSMVTLPFAGREDAEALLLLWRSEQ